MWVRPSPTRRNPAPARSSSCPCAIFPRARRTATGPGGQRGEGIRNQQGRVPGQRAHETQEFGQGEEGATGRGAQEKPAQEISHCGYRKEGGTQEGGAASVREVGRGSREGEGSALGPSQQHQGQE